MQHFNFLDLKYTTRGIDCTQCTPLGIKYVLDKSAVVKI